MKTPKTMRGMMVVALAILSGPAGVFAQRIEQVIGPEADFALMKEKIWMAAELSFGTKPIKGAPYSAEAVKEIDQMLIDGNRIYRRTASSIYRDSEGRTRHEQNPIGVGPFVAGDEPLVFINDPVAGVTYVMEARTRTARKSTHMALNRRPPAELARAHFKARPDDSPGNVRRESLGKQMLEGVEAEGTRTVITIPAGQIGNERAIEIVSERWYSDELAAVIMSRELDPRSGETRYRLTNLSRAEPPHALFEVPSDYTIEDAGSHAGHPQMVIPRVKFDGPKP